MTPDDQLRFAQQIGEVDIHPYAQTLEGYEAIQLLDSEEGGRADVWHTDASFRECPPMGTILRCITGPSRGGDTMWSNQVRAYERVSAPLKELLEGLTALHVPISFGKFEVVTEHPVVRVHPETGERALYVNRSFTARIPQLEPTESTMLVDHLCNWAVRPEFTCRWSWRPGDLAMWDNRSTQHLAVNDYDDRRIMHRVILAGDRPVGGRARWPHHAEGKESSSVARRRALSQPR
jgi:taurine dioxygenase